MSEKQSDSTMQPFTRHLFRSVCDCPTKLFYKRDPNTYPETQKQLPFLAHIRYNKRQLRRLLQLCYPNGVNIEHRNYKKSAEETSGRLTEDYTVLYNASFLQGNLFARVPLLEKDGRRVRLFYLKTKAFNPERHATFDRNGRVHPRWRDYIRDVTYLVHVIGEAHPQWKIEPYLVLPDKTATTSIDCLDKKLVNGSNIAPRDAARLLAFIDVAKPVDLFLSGKEPVAEENWAKEVFGNLSFDEIIEKISGWYVNRTKIDVGVGKKCANCEFRVDQENLEKGQRSGFHECWKDVPGYKSAEPHIFDLIGAGNGELLENQIFLQQNVDLSASASIKQIMKPGGRISDQHRRILQVAKAKGRELPREIIKPKLFEELKKWKYPLHFLDFEAGSFAVPVRAGKNPYDMVIFQFSCHTLYEDGTLRHHQWLHSADESYPNYEIVKHLMKVPDFSSGTIIHYSGFERAALKRVRSELESDPNNILNHKEQIIWLAGITGQQHSSPMMADLSHLVKFYYYNREMADSLSVKDVLKAIMKISPELQKRFSKPYKSSNFKSITWWQQQNGSLVNPYELLRDHSEDAVGKGAEAMTAYASLRTGALDAETANNVRKGLLRYCELDTLAMVMIYIHWKSLMANKV